ncbi:hypothetical protein KIW84_040148 [Lathyrus oleraceus]|uniref:Uncharacterized protein n=1 Tax=Pisum sativum TaxID=3888 RepID=A0A9D4X699_PEA|nr:hypothetical protein KIW84_040148 [Pisum sativum]
MHMVGDIIPQLVDDNMNVILTQLPSVDEITAVVFSLNKNSVTGPYGFRVVFYQAYWDIIKVDVSNFVIDFFLNGWILSSFNSNSIMRKELLFFLYLGVPLFKGKPNKLFLQFIAYKIINKLASWKGSLLYFAGMSVTLAWDNVCKLIAEGGIGIRSLCMLNEASNLKLAWDIFNSSCSWAILIQKRVMRNNKNDKSISLWFDNWSGYPLYLDDDAPVLLDEPTVNGTMVNGHWGFAKSSTNILIRVDIRPDKRCWNHYSNGDLSLKFAYKFKRNRGTIKNCWRWIWNNFIPPSKSFMVRRLLQNKLSTNDQ